MNNVLVISKLRTIEQYNYIKEFIMKLFSL